MSQTKQWAASATTTTRRNTKTGATAGQGGSQRLYIGRRGDYQYASLAKFALDWTDVGKIVSATLSWYTGDGLGDLPASTVSVPYVIFRRLTSAFVEGNAPDGTWQSNDYTAPSGTSSSQVVHQGAALRASLTLHQENITAIVEQWAPKTVQKRDGTAGGGSTNYGLSISGNTDPVAYVDLTSRHYPDPTFLPFITLTYEYGPTAPDAPTNVTPSGSVASINDFQGDFTDVATNDKLARSTVEVYDAGTAGTASATTDAITSAAHGLKNLDQVYFTSLTGGTGLVAFTKYYVRNVTTDTFQVSAGPTSGIENLTVNYTALTWSKLLYSATQSASAAEVQAAHFIHTPDSLHLVPGRTYRWRSRVIDNDGSVGAWTALVSFSVSNTDPVAPTLTPASGASRSTLDSVHFRGTYSDADGDAMLAFQVQLSAYPEGDSHWDDDAFILWNTGKRYVGVISSAATGFDTLYGGSSLASGTYYWRARVWDVRGGLSSWTYATITVTSDFQADPDTSQTAIQLRPRAPWRIVIRDMGALRGPGSIVAVLEDAKNAGASELYNSPGELHFTLQKDHPQISVIEPKQTHYAVEFWSGDGWREKFAGLMWDFDASDTDVVFYGLDYVALLDLIADERYDASNPDKPAEKGGSKYVTAGKNSINYIVTDQLTRAKALPNSPVGFITVGSIATMNETLTVFSTYAQVLTFITGLLDSHRAGTGKRTRLRCQKTNAGGYQWVVVDDPGQARDNLRLRFGELVQGYRVVAFGNDWASRVSSIGRAKDGVKVMYTTATSPGIDESVWGRFNRVTFIDGVSDQNDLLRRTKQAAVRAGKLGKSIALGIRSGFLQPKDGYDLCDYFPIDIEDGSVSTSAFGSGYWSAVGVTWEADATTGKQNTTLTFQPREDSVAPDTDLLTLQPISPQAEWQIGWASPNPLTASSKYWLDQTTGKVYRRQDGTLIFTGITGTA